MTYSRRSLAMLLPAMAAAQQAPRQDKPVPSGAYPFDKITGRQSGPIQLYQILAGPTHSGFKLDLHETELPAGGAPHAPHRHVHEEFIFVWQGEVEVTINGAATKLGPGGCAYMASNDLHGYHNTGAVPAKYFVLALGED